MRLQTLIATMHRQHEYQFLDSMNLEGEVIVINQCDELGIEYRTGDAYTATIVSSKKRGISNSRNEAILYSDADIFLTGDDDIVYRKGYAQMVLDKFEAHPDADIIAFNIDRLNVSQGMIMCKPCETWREAPKNKYYGSVRLAYRKAAFEKANLHFHPLFGTGSVYLSGEESLVLRAARKQGLKVYESSEILAEADFLNSTWFNGYDARFFRDKGAWVKCAYPYTYWFMKYYFLTKKKNTTLSYWQILHEMNAGIKSLN